MARAAASVTIVLPWWAAGGDAVCHFCLQRYPSDLAYRCESCDRPLCPSCATRLSLAVVEVHCSDCGREAAGEEG